MSALPSLHTVLLPSVISCFFVHVDSENICFCLCHCLICNFPFTKAIKWITRVVIRWVFSFVRELGSLKMASSRALHTSCAVNIISPDPSKAFFSSLLFFVSLAGELSKATESFRQEMGVHFYASRSTSEVGFYKNNTCIEWVLLHPILTWQNSMVWYNFPLLPAHNLTDELHITHVMEYWTYFGISYMLCKNSSDFHFAPQSW